VDYDGINENMLETDGRRQGSQGARHFDRNGFAYVLDRSDGTLLRANKYVTTNWAEKVDMKTGRPVKVKEHSPFAPGGNTQACPSGWAARTSSRARSTRPSLAWRTARPTTGAWKTSPRTLAHAAGHGVRVRHVYMYPEKPGITGKFKKFNFLTGETVWKSRTRIRIGAERCH